MNKQDKTFFGTGSSQMAKETWLKQDENVDIEEQDLLTLGPYNSLGILQDPKRFGFLMSRHKFVSKMFADFDNVLEIGCQEGMGSLIVSQTVKKLTSVDFYKPHIQDAQKYMGKNLDNVTFQGHDIIGGPVEGTFDGVFTMDVFEHIDPQQAGLFMENIVASMTPQGTLILGIPSLESQKYASKASKEGHINCMSGADLKAFCEQYFHNVYPFGMNDEVVHTGFFPMCQYLIMLCVAPKKE
ncbi:class I SAM-dependent methyltransferase [Pseudoalteromonas piscicida]|uniref:class I SAM-dependent methyltransferase n=2 Tax=Pseudoalteromonas piscicida TaxID=43662 RepID=UPI0030C8E259